MSLINLKNKKKILKMFALDTNIRHILDEILKIDVFQKRRQTISIKFHDKILNIDILEKSQKAMALKKI